MSKSIFVIRHADGYLEENFRDSFSVTSSVYDAKEYKRLGNALRVMQQIGADEVIELAEDNRLEWRGSYQQILEAGA